MTFADSTNIENLWTRVRAMYARARAALGRVADIAALGALTPKLRRSIIAWLAPLEHVVRKLLFAEAARIAAATASRPQLNRLIHIHLGAPTHPHAQPRANTASARPIDLSHPYTWRAQFSLAIPHDPHAVPDARAPRIRALWGNAPPPPPPMQRQHSAPDPSTAAFRLARRFEALRRVLDDPLPLARKLAGLLMRLRRIFPEVIHRYAWASPRSGAYDADDPRLGVHAYGAAFAAEVAFESSG